MATYMLYLLFVGVLAMVLGTVTNVIRSYRRLSHIPGPLHVEWHQRGPFIVQARRFARDGPWMTSLRMFTQQYWLEASSWVIMARKVATRQNLRHLSITIRHSDWWWSESSAPLALDAKQKGKPLAKRHSTATDVFHVQSWGNQFSMFKGMKTFELELETVEGKRKELDEVIVRAADWRFPLGDCNFLVLNPARTKRTGWQVRTLLAHYTFVQANLEP